MKALPRVEPMTESRQMSVGACATIPSDHSLDLNLDHPFWDLDVGCRGTPWLDKVIDFLNRW